MNKALIQFLTRGGFLKLKNPDVSTVLRACLSSLSASPAEFVLANLEDLWNETRPQNVPGTWNERPNWQRKARLTLEQVLQSPDLKETLQRLDTVGRETARSGNGSKT